jgi:Mycothiol maleylpyruvate isomerase N-terminal domain
MSTGRSPIDLLTELRFALAEADTETPSRHFRAGLLTAAMAKRAPGLSANPAAHVSGLEALRRMGSRLASLLTQLELGAWAKPTVRDLDVQGLVGHLIGVETAFAATLQGETAASEADHVESTQPSALRQRGRPPSQTLEEWSRSLERTIALAAAEVQPHRPVRFYGLGLGLDALLVARAFELWTHDEDIRRATGHALEDPDPETLRRMVELAAPLLPAGIAMTGASLTDVSARLVLTGPAGGTWDVLFRGRRVTRAKPGQGFDAHIVVDAAQFCRVAANRGDLVGSGAVVSSDLGAARTLFAGAAALALD